MKKICLFLVVLSLILPINYVKAEDVPLAGNAVSAILLEASTGEIIFSKNPHERLEPASMTKIMSMLLIIESIEKGIIKWDEMVTVSENASGMGGSQILLETNEKMSVEDLFKGVAIASGNDAVVALAEKIAGTEDNFVAMMNNRAKELGLKNTNFKNSHGLEEANHYSSAYDMAIMAKELVKHEKVLEYTSIYETYLRQNTDRKVWLVNTNKLVRFYDGVDGLKTGYTDQAGYCLTATAKKGNMRLIAVVMKEPDTKTRNKEITEMLDYAFAQYEIEVLLSKDTVITTKKVEKGDETKVGIVPMENVNILNKKMDKKRNVTYDISLDNLVAPLKYGDIVGTITIKDNNKILKTVNLTVKKDIKKANIFLLYWRNIKDIIGGSIKI